MKTTNQIRIHRHVGNVALSFDGTGTIYLSQEQAAWLVRKLTQAVRDIEARSFLRSRFETTEWPHCNAPLEALKRACSKGEPIVEIPAPHLKQFTVVTVSTNTNSFGYKSVLCLAEDGEGFEFLVQAYGCEAVPARGDKVQRHDPRFYGLPRMLPKITPAQAKKIMKELQTN